MSTPKHTPGPWEVTGPHSREVITANPGTYKPCMTIAKVGGYWDGEAQANAHLISAAPEMLAALRAALAVCEAEAELRGENDVDDYHGGAAGPVAEMIRAAIAHAEGQA